MRRFATLLLLLFAAPALAQTPGNCEHGSAQADLDVSGVRAGLFNNGNLFFGNDYVSGNGYVVPKFSGHSPVFAANLWVGGTVGGELRSAAATYFNFEFWPGPLDAGATLPDPADCSPYDRIWTVSTLDVQHYEDTGEATADLAEWPVELGAEVIDGDGIEGNYDLAGGDRPRIYGSQTAFWVMNDVGNDHAFTDSAPLGLEVRVTAFAVASLEPALNETTFYRFTLVNRNTLPLEQAYVALWADLELGDASDDYIGSDSTRSLAFVYNGYYTDAVYGIPPAAGFDLLSGARSSRWPRKGLPPEILGPPNSAQGLVNAVRGLWNDSTPITESGYGYMTNGPVTIWTFPGDPVTAQCWSAINACGATGPQIAPEDVRHLISSPSFTLQPGEARTFDAAFLFAQGSNHLDSITELRAASDLVQAAYDDGSLFDPVAPGPVLSTPEPIAPAEGAFFVGQLPVLQWISVPEAAGYTVRVGLSPELDGAGSASTAETEFVPGGLPPNEVVDVYWQVRAEDGMGGLSPYSAPRSFQFYRYESDDFGGGIGIVETTHPEVEDVCADDPDDAGCAAGYEGNTVWLDPNSTADYVLTTPNNSLQELFRNLLAAAPDDFEIRFTEVCATFGNCLGVFASAIPGGTDLIASVPFELWNVGRKLVDVPEDAVRMIPILRAHDGTTPSADWADSFPATQEVIAGIDTLELNVTHRVIGVMPDRPNGYALFAAAAQGFGGPGAIYDPEQDGDTQIDLNPATGSPCGRQSYYADFCYQGGSNNFVGPIGGIAGLVLADLAGDGTTPPAGTVVRFDSNEPLFVDAEDEAPVQPSAFALGAAYPNPFARSATVPFEVAESGRVRLSVYDVLGRQVAVLVDGEVTAGSHRAEFDGSRLASGVYLVVLEADGRRQSRKVLLVR